MSDYSDNDNDTYQDNDGYTTTEDTTWCGRMGNACVGVLIGLLLFVASCVVIFWNEGNAVNEAKMLAEALSECMEQSCSFDPALVGKLIHVTCDLKQLEVLEDPPLGVSYAGLILSRNVEMYQWIEESSCRTEKKFGGGTRKTCDYTYKRDWASYYVDSSSFHRTTKRNPPWPLETTVLTANSVQLGDYVLSAWHLAAMSAHTLPLLLSRHPDYLPSPDHPPEVITPLNTQLCGQTQYYTGNCSRPVIGDMRFSYTVTNATAISVVGRLTEDRSFGGWLSSHKRKLGPLVAAGAVDMDLMFNAEEHQLVVMTWSLRAAGLVACWLGLQLIAAPLSVAPDIIPCVGGCVGSLVGGALCCATLAMALCVGLVDMSIAWLFYRPLIGLPLLGVGLLGLVWGCCGRRNRGLPKVDQHYEPIAATPSPGSGGWLAGQGSGPQHSQGHDPQQGGQGYGYGQQLGGQASGFGPSAMRPQDPYGYGYGQQGPQPRYTHASYGYPAPPYPTHPAPPYPTQAPQPYGFTPGHMAMPAAPPAYSGQPPPLPYDPLAHSHSHIE